MIVIGEYKPTSTKAWRVGRDLVKITRAFGLVPHVSPPMLKILEKCSWKDQEKHASVVRYARPEYEGSGWHQDGDHAPGADMNCFLVVWADRDPTEIRYVNQARVFRPEPYQLVLFHNLTAYHRRPPGVSGKRMMFRQRVQWPSITFASRETERLL